jgi:hypothetical protein
MQKLMLASVEIIVGRPQGNKRFAHNSSGSKIASSIQTRGGPTNRAERPPLTLSPESSVPHVAGHSFPESHPNPDWDEISPSPSPPTSENFFYPRAGIDPSPLTSSLYVNYKKS